ncbi:PBSX family phage terminase large subunit [Saccharibacter sp. 17.LH.SD]|uniref:PBSX family phage terminase large subunit n=1 Tax=Saccharibacter sp. 17.LH.SD TaxID=2689393 RepID=UPI00136DFED9|nr:PBSX family phage terminase large subunit [Saccharibacter sp. 17.LH.SD]MXV43476.1 PBSX family phage terminase large subunit [Saccharibacter sp. 17.LH.SD]
MAEAITVKLHAKFGNFSHPYRYRLWHGGRGGGKSWAIAKVLVLLTMSRTLRVLCCREYQNSMADSVHKLLSDQISELGLSPWFTILENSIRAYNGSEFLFKGLARNIQSIKSTEGVDIAWVEEAQTLSQDSIDLLLPTIRKKGSEVWFTWNPLEEGAPIEKLKESLLENPRAFISQINWSDNPWLPETLNEERLRCYEHDPENYEHIWEGAYRAHGSSFFKLSHLLIDNAPSDTPSFCDCVYAVIDTTLKGGAGNDGTGVIYFSLDNYNQSRPLTVLDWDIVEIEGSMLEEWAPVVVGQLEHYARLTKARSGSIGLFIEDKAAGSVVIPQLQRNGYPVQPIESKLTSMGKDQRALNASPYVHREQITLTRHAFDKTTIFRGQSRNHFLTQVFNFILNDKDAARRADDLLDCFCYGVVIGLGDNTGL